MGLVNEEEQNGLSSPPVQNGQLTSSTTQQSFSDDRFTKALGSAGGLQSSTTPTGTIQQSFSDDYFTKALTGGHPLDLSIPPRFQQLLRQQKNFEIESLSGEAVFAPYGESRRVEGLIQNLFEAYGFIESECLDTNVFFVPSHVDWPSVERFRGITEANQPRFPDLRLAFCIGDAVSVICSRQPERSGCRWLASQVILTKLSERKSNNAAACGTSQLLSQQAGSLFPTPPPTTTTSGTTSCPAGFSFCACTENNRPTSASTALPMAAVQLQFQSSPSQRKQRPPALQHQPCSPSILPYFTPTTDWLNRYRGQFSLFARPSEPPPVAAPMSCAEIPEQYEYKLWNGGKYFVSLPDFVPPAAASVQQSGRRLFQTPVAVGPVQTALGLPCSLPCCGSRTVVTSAVEEEMPTAAALASSSSLDSSTSTSRVTTSSSSGGGTNKEEQLYNILRMLHSQELTDEAVDEISRLLEQHHQPNANRDRQAP